MAPPPGMVPVAAEPAPTPPPAPEPAVMHTPAAQQISTGPQLPPRTSQQQQQDDMSEDRDKAPAVAAATAGGSPPAAPKTHMGVALQLPQQQAQDQEDQEGQGQEQEAADAPEGVSSQPLLLMLIFIKSNIMSTCLQQSRAALRAVQHSSLALWSGQPTYNLK